MKRKYHVALSFAGEDRDYVQRVASKLASEGVEVFYDEFEEAALWGKNLYTHLRDVYENKALFTVMFISEHYKSNVWTNHERESAQARALESNQEYILPAFFDTSVKVPGLPKTIGHISLLRKTPEEFAEVIVKKLQQSGVELSAEFAYSEDAKADVDFPHPLGTKVGAILNDLKSHTWPTQAPAVDATFKLDWKSLNKNEIFVLGRNIYQCACGSEWKAVEVVSNLREKLAGLTEGRCPLCGSVLSNEDFVGHLAEIERTIERHNETLKRLSAEEANRSAFYATRVTDLENLNRQQRQAAAEVETRRGNLRSLEESAKNLDVPLDAAAITVGVDACQSKIRELEVGLAEFEASTAYGRVGDLDKQRLLAEQDVEALATEMERFSAAAQNAKAAEDAARRVSWEAVDDSMAALSPLLSELYVRLKPHIDYEEVRYRMRGDVKRFLSFAVGSDINPRFTFSSGQRRALGLAFLLAVHLSRPWCKLKTLILDDPVQHIDDYRALRFAEVLSSIRQLGQQVICTVEDPELADLLCRRLRSFAMGDGLRIELEYEPGSGSRVKSVREIAPLPDRLLLTA